MFISTKKKVTYFYDLLCFRLSVVINDILFSLYLLRTLQNQLIFNLKKSFMKASIAEIEIENTWNKVRKSLVVNANVKV